MPSLGEPPLVHHVQANGLTHRLLEWSSPHARGTAFLLHGFGDAGATWQRVAEGLVASGFRVLAPDLRGFGEGPRAPTGSYYHFADYVADVAGIVAAIDASALFLVGHSMGGTIATYYAAAFPERITKVALLEGLGPPDAETSAMPDRLRAWIDQVNAVRLRGERPVGSRDEAFRRLQGNHPKVDPATLRDVLPELIRDLDDGRVAWRADPLHKTRGPIAFAARGYLACAGRIRCPVLHIGGGPNGFHVLDEEARLAAFPSITRVELPDAGHMMHWTRPRELTETLVGFWTT